MKKRLYTMFSLFTAFLIVMNFFPALQTDAFSFTPPFEVNSQSAIVYNVDTDTVVYQKAADTRQMPSHLTQIMTAIICLESCEDIKNTRFTCPTAVFTDISTYREMYPDIYIPVMGITEEQEFSVEELLYGMLLSSACDAADMLAYHIGSGTIRGFVEMMNVKAAEIGCTSTNFVNAHGLYDSNQYTTASDILKIVNYALTLDRFEMISSTQSYEITDTSEDNSDAITITHTNLMIDRSSDYYFESAKGIKTGYCNEGGRSLAVQAKNGSNNYIVILLNAPINDENNETWYSHFDDARSLLQWAFEHFSIISYIERGEELNEVPIKDAVGNDYVIAIADDNVSFLWHDTSDKAYISREYDIVENLTAPVAAGTKVGTLSIIFENEVIDTVDLVIAEDVERSQFKHFFSLMKGFKDSKWFNIAILFSVIFTVLYFVLYIYRYNELKKRRRPVQKRPPQRPNPKR